jgi:hypothetical protein
VDSYVDEFGPIATATCLGSTVDPDATVVDHRRRADIEHDDCVFVAIIAVGHVSADDKG